MGYITIDEADIKALKKHGLVTTDDYLTKEGACMIGRLEADKLYGEIIGACIEGVAILCETDMIPLERF